MEKMIYNDRVRHLAIQMAETFRPNNWPLYTDEEKQQYASFCTPIARIVVSKMAEAVKHSWCAGGELWEFEEKMCSEYLIEYGLIPDKQPDTLTENNNWKL